MARTAPTPVDVQDFQFKLHCRLKIFDNEDHIPFKTPCNLIATASRFGLVFVGTCNSTFQVIQTKNIEEHQLKDGETTDYFCRTITLTSQPRHLSVNCDNTKVAVVIEKNGCSVAVVYEVASFFKQSICVITEIRLSATPGVHIVDTSWNPTLSTIFTACKSDGSLGIYELKQQGIEIKELPTESGATCMCWSPKGKQLAVGSRDGKITQYKPELTAMKVINTPPLAEVQSVLSLKWISNYQFIAVYKSQNPDSPANVLVIDAPKTGDTVFTNYDDICYSYGTTRPSQFYMLFQSTWNILMVSSSNSMEVGVLNSEKEQWTQLILGDAARAELPLSHSRQDTLPIGIAFDTAVTEPLPWGESSLPPAPFLFLLSHQGLLCCFKVVNMKPGTTAICHAPEALTDKSGLSQFVKPVSFSSQLGVPFEKNPTQPQLQANTNSPASTFSFGNALKQTGSTFAQQTVPNTIQPTQPLFGGNQPKLTATQPTQSLFAPPTSTPLFGGNKTVGTTPPSQSVFGVNVTTSVSTRSNQTLFSINQGSTGANQQTQPLFHTNNTLSGPTQSLFGGNQPASAATQSVFGGKQPTSVTATAQSSFGGNLPTLSATQPLFGGNQLSSSTTQPTPSLFGGVQSSLSEIHSSTTEKPSFGTNQANATAKFGLTVQNKSEPQALFGSQTQTSSTVLGPKPSPPNLFVNKPQTDLSTVSTTTLPATSISPNFTPPNISTAKPKKVESNEIPEASQDTEVLIANMVREECKAIEDELAMLLFKGRCVKIDLGNEVEATELVFKTDSLQEFLSEVADTSNSQAAEIHCLKQNLIQTWMWYEDAQSRFGLSKDPKMAMLLQVKPLDPASQRQLADIQHLLYYLESQMIQASHALDEQWESFQDSCKTSIQFKIPSIEAIYQTMVRQNAILQKQKYILKDVATRIRSHQRSKCIGSSLIFSLDNADQIEEELQRLHLGPEDLFYVQYERVLNRQQRLTKSKINKLKSYIMERDVTHVSVNKPQLSSSMLSQFNSVSTPRGPGLGGVKKTLFPQPLTSLLGAAMSPIITSVPPSGFTQSTPVSSIFQSTAMLHKEPEQQKSQMGVQKVILVPQSKGLSNVQTFTMKPTGAALESFSMLPSNVLKTSSASDISQTTESAKMKPSVFQYNVASTASDKSTGSTTFVFKSNLNVPTTQSGFTSGSTKGVSFNFVPTTVTPANLIFSPSVSGNTGGAPSSSAVNTKSGLTIKPSFNFTITTTSTKTSPNSSQVVTSSTILPSTNLSAFVATSQSTPFGEKVVNSSIASPTSFSNTPSTASSAIFNIANTSSDTVFKFGSPQNTVASSSTPVSATSFSTVAQLKTQSATTNTGSSKIITIGLKSEIATPFTGSTVPTNVSKESVSALNLAKSQSTATIAPSLVIEKVTKSIEKISTDNNSTFGTSTATTVQTTITPISEASTNIFGSQSQNNLFQTAKNTQGSIFGGISSTPNQSSPSASTIFAVVTSATPTSVFGSVPAVSNNLFFDAAVVTSSSNLIKNVPSTASSDLTSSNASVSTVPITTTSSIFGSGTATSPSSSIFGAAITTPTNAVHVATGVIFGSTPSTKSNSIFGGAINSTSSLVSSGTASSTANSVLCSATNPTPSTVFGGAITSTASSVFGSATSTTGSLFGGTTTSSIFGSIPTTSSSIFGTVTPTTSSSIFGAVTPTTSSSIFGAVTPTTNSSIFGAATPTTSSSVFGTATPTTTGTIFGASALTKPSSEFNVTSSETSGSVFGTATTKSASTFGTSPFPTNGSIFGTSAPAVSGSLFGAGTPTVSNTAFGAADSTTTGSPFGAATPTTNSSVFGSTPVFGGVNSTFGTPTTQGFGTPTSSIFGSPTSPMSGFGNVPKTSASVFGATPSFGTTSNTFGTTTAGSIFGQTSTFGSGSTFGASAGPTSAFGNTSSPFGSNTSVFGTPATSNSAFDMTNTSQSAFGASSQFSFSSAAATSVPSSTSAFGFQKPGSFGVGSSSTPSSSFSFAGLNVGSSTTTASGFGTDSFGQTQNPFSKVSTPEPKSPFGSIFNTPATTSSSIFGGNTTSVFGSPSQSFGSSPFGQQTSFGQSPFGGSFVSQPSGPFSGGSQTVSQTGFGSFGEAQKQTGGFGGQPVFGGSPGGAFGSPPTFGGSPAFGSSPAFGATTPTGTFGSNQQQQQQQQQSSAFGNLANQNTIGFSALAQQSQSPSPSSGFSGGSSFSTWR